MKITKKIIAACLAASIAMSAFLFASCAGKDKDGTEPPEEENKLTVSSIKIAGNDISEYTVVCALPDITMRKLGSKLSTEYNFNKLVADELVLKIEEYTGIQLKIAYESSDVTDREILIGNTNRSQSGKYSSLEVHNYAIAVEESKLVISGGAPGNVYHALDYLFEALESRAAENSDVDFEEGFTLEGTHHLTTIACIGDSITAGVGSSNAAYLAWPAVLSRLLWQDCYVMNLGNSGKTMRNDLADAYKKTSEYQTALRSAADVDIALIMLGTNDSNRDRSWTASDDKSFNDSCKELVSLMHDKNENMKFVIMNCPVYQGDGNFGSEQVRNLQAKLVPVLKAGGYDVSFYDMYTYTKNTVTISRFPDGLHPNDEGHALMAKGVAKMLEPLLGYEETEE